MTRLEFISSLFAPLIAGLGLSKKNENIDPIEYLDVSDVDVSYKLYDTPKVGVDSRLEVTGYSLYPGDRGPIVAEWKIQ